MTEHYDTILAALKMRILEKHRQYGISYLDDECTIHWLLNHRLEGELRELRDALTGEYPAMSIITEALDVAVCALLIADKQAKKVEK